MVDSEEIYDDGGVQGGDDDGEIYDDGGAQGGDDEEVYDDGKAETTKPQPTNGKGSDVKGLRAMFEANGPIRAGNNPGAAASKPSMKPKPAPTGPKPAVTSPKPASGTSKPFSPSKPMKPPKNPVVSSNGLLAGKHPSEIINELKKRNNEASGNGTLPGKKPPGLGSKSSADECVKDFDGRGFLICLFRPRPKLKSKPADIEDPDLPKVMYVDDVEVRTGERARGGNSRKGSSVIKSYTEEDEMNELGVPLDNQECEGFTPPPLPLRPKNIGNGILSPMGPTEPEEEYSDVNEAPICVHNEPDPSEEVYDVCEDGPATDHSPTSATLTSKNSDADKKKKQKKKEEEELRKAKEKEEKMRTKEMKEQDKLKKRYKLTEEELTTSHSVKSTVDQSGGKNSLLPLKRNEHVFLIRRLDSKKWIVRNSMGMIGLVDASKMLDSEDDGVPVNGNADFDDDDQDLYEEISAK